MSPLGAGSTLCDGRYQLESVVGRGGMAVVWQATDLQLERTVAIKVISDVLATDPRFVARFEREARLAASLTHPNLVKVFDFSIDGERPFLIMEYIPGGTLVDARGRGLDAEAVARELLDAVAHIHAAGILHRDIKPANVLLGADGSPRLTDFGIARGDETTGLTQTGQVLGTLKYIAPEAAAGEPATAQSDLYSLGILLGEIAGDSPSPVLADLIRRMSAREPSLRPASAADALAELDPTAALAPTAAVPQTDQTAATAPLDASATTPLGAPAAASIGVHVHKSRTFAIKPSHAIAAAAALVAILVIIVIAASSGGGDSGSKSSTKTVQAAPAGTPADQQIDQLERMVNAAAGG